MKDVPDDFRPGPLGERGVLRAAIAAALPEAEAQDKDWFFLRTKDIDLSIQFHMEDTVQVRYILIHVHGGSESPQCVARVVRALGLRALDTAHNDFFDTANPERGFAAWQKK